MRNFVKESIEETLKTTGYKLEEMTELESVMFRKSILEKIYWAEKISSALGSIRRI
jgi:hypothetical protein